MTRSIQSADPRIVRPDATMHATRELGGISATLRDDLRRCIRCAACLTSCPTYLLDQHEAEGPRGRIAMMSAILDGNLPPSRDVVAHLDSCLLCEACSRACPAGVEMESLGVRFREVLGRNGSGTARLAQQVIARWLFGDLARFRVVARLLRWYQRSGLQWLARHSGILTMLRLRDAERLLPPIPARFVEAKGQQVGTGQPADLFVGCVMSTAFAGTTEATARVLGVFGYRATLTPRQACCGALQLHSGDLDTARQLASRNIEAFGGSADRPIVVNAAGCGAMLKHYGALMPNDPLAAAFSARVRDITELLAAGSATLPPRQLRPTKVAIQDACHHIHAQRLAGAPRELLSAVPGVQLIDIAEAGVCCGSAGIYNLTHATTSGTLQRRKCDHIVASGCDMVVTTNPGCLLQIKAALPPDIRVAHIVDLLDEAYSTPPEAAG